MAYSPSPIRRDSVISQAAQEICRFIEAERLAPGEALPPETRLSQMLGISRNSAARGAARAARPRPCREGGGAARRGHRRLAGRQEHVRRERAARGGADRQRGALPHRAEMRGTRGRAPHRGRARRARTRARRARTGDRAAGSGRRQGRARHLPRPVPGERPQPAAGRHVQPGAGGAAVQRLARAPELLRSAPSRASPRAAARAAQARRARRRRRGAQALPQPGADARIRDANAKKAGSAGARAGAASRGAVR